MLLRGDTDGLTWQDVVDWHSHPPSTVTAHHVGNAVLLICILDAKVSLTYRGPSVFGKEQADSEAGVV